MLRDADCRARTLRRVMLSAAIAVCVGCTKAEANGGDGSGGPQDTAPAPVTSYVTVPPTTIPTAPPDQVADCEWFTQFAAYLGDAEMLELWNAAGQDEATLRAMCAQIGLSDPVRLAWFSARRDEAEAFMAAAEATTAPQPPPPTQPPATQPPTTPPSTAPPVTVPPATLPVVVQTPQNDCHPNYSGACVPIASDVDCLPGSGNGPAYVSGPVQVIGSDVYGLDRDNDGIGCE
jgi:hypothetical protein